MSGFHFIPKNYGAREAAPVKGTWLTENGEAADLLRSAYPITATCSNCGGPIPLEDRLKYGWQHVPAEGAAR
jgi:hypothetical protein